MRDQTLAGIKASPVFSVLIDETMDIRTTEQMIIYVKYVSSSPHEVTTKFVGIVPVSSLILSGIAMTNCVFEHESHTA